MAGSVNRVPLRTVRSPMQRVIAAVARLVRQREGQDLLEYGLLAALIAIFAMGAVAAVGKQIYNVFWVPIAQNF